MVVGLQRGLLGERGAPVIGHRFLCWSALMTTACRIPFECVISGIGTRFVATPAHSVGVALGCARVAARAARPLLDPGWRVPAGGVWGFCAIAVQVMAIMAIATHASRNISWRQLHIHFRFAVWTFEADVVHPF